MFTRAWQQNYSTPKRIRKSCQNHHCMLEPYINVSRLSMSLEKSRISSLFVLNFTKKHSKTRLLSLSRMSVASSILALINLLTFKEDNITHNNRLILNVIYLFRLCYLFYGRTRSIYYKILLTKIKLKLFIRKNLLSSDPSIWGKIKLFIITYMIMYLNKKNSIFKEKSSTPAFNTSSQDDLLLFADDTALNQTK